MCLHNFLNSHPPNTLKRVKDRRYGLERCQNRLIFLTSLLVNIKKVAFLFVPTRLTFERRNYVSMYVITEKCVLQSERVPLTIHQAFKKEASESLAMVGSDTIEIETD